MGAALVPILVAVGSTAASAVISNQLADKPTVPTPIAPPAPPEIPEDTIGKEAIDPESLAQEQAAKARSARRREAARAAGTKVSSLDDKDTSNTTLLGD